MLKITEIFFSLQGETTFVGLPTVFIRLTGCPLRCQYCDSAYAFSGGENLSVEDVLQKVAEYPTRYVTVSGGEPLAQPDCLPLLKKLCDQGYTVSLETSGALDVSQVDPRVVKIMDIKTPGSLEVKKNRYDNLFALDQKDQLKFVICSRKDYEWSREFIQQKALVDKHVILFSPSFHEVKSSDLAEWILSDGLAVRFQTQLHKQIWGDVPGK